MPCRSTLLSGFRCQNWGRNLRIGPASLPFQSRFSIRELCDMADHWIYVLEDEPTEFEKLCDLVIKPYIPDQWDEVKIIWATREAPLPSKGRHSHKFFP